jgi:hypothetical protein
MLVRGVVDDEIDEDADAAAVGLAHEFDEVSAGAETPVDAVEVGDVVAVVPSRRRLERGEPNRSHAEAFEVIETPGQPFEIADAVAVRVEVGLDVEAVDDRALVPEVADHASTSRSVRYIACDQRSGTAGSPHRSTHGP